MVYFVRIVMFGIAAFGIMQGEPKLLTSGYDFNGSLSLASTHMQFYSHAHSTHTHARVNICTHDHTRISFSLVRLLFRSPPSLCTIACCCYAFLVFSPQSKHTRTLFSTL